MLVNHVNVKLFNILQFKLILTIVVFVLLSFSAKSAATPENTVPPSAGTTAVSPGKQIELTVANRNRGRNRYFTDLLEQALIEYGYKPKIEYLGVVSYQRQMVFMDDGTISLMWRLRSKARDKAFLRVDTPLTGGLIGQRVFFITKGTQHKFNNIQSLKDLQSSALVGGFGEKWFDIEVWKHNSLPYLELRGATKKIYPMLQSGNRGFDYFSRGINEILNEAKLYPEIDIEQNLLVVYPLDSYFYLGKSAVAHHKVISEAMQHAQKSGLIQRLTKTYFGELEETLKLKDRHKIHLSLP